jgi:hypothetical protein
MSLLPHPSSGSAVDLQLSELDRAYKMAQILAEVFDPRQVHLSFTEGQESLPRFLVSGLTLQEGGPAFSLSLTQDPQVGKWRGEAKGLVEEDWDLVDLLAHFGLYFTKSQSDQFRERVGEILAAPEP